MQTVMAPSRVDLERIRPVIAHPRSGAPLVWGKDHSVAAEEFRLLARRLHRYRVEKPIQSVLITSALPAEGKSTVALNLAATLERQGGRTVLIDTNLRGAEIHDILGLDAVPGLSEVLSGHIALDRALRRVDPLGLYFLASGDAVGNPVSLFETPEFPNLLKQVRQAFEWVILDSPPLNRLADSQCIAAACDATLLVVRWGFTPRTELEHVIALLDGYPVLGMVINTFYDPLDSYYDSHYENRKSLLAMASGPASMDPGEPATEGHFQDPSDHRKPKRG